MSYFVIVWQKMIYTEISHTHTHIYIYIYIYIYMRVCVCVCSIVIYAKMIRLFNLTKLSIDFLLFSHNLKGAPRGVMVKAMDCRIVVSGFVFQSRYYVHFWTNTLGKDMNPRFLPGMG